MNTLKQINDTKELGKWYDKKYEEMGGAWNTPGEACKKHLERICMYNDSNDSTLLDIGCGGGHFLEHASELFLTAGIEISEVGLEETSERAPKSNLFFEDIENTSFDNGAFNIVTSIGSLEHVVNLGDALKEIYRILSKDGICYVYAPNTEWIHEDQPNEIIMDKEEWIEKTKNYFELLFFEKDNDNNIYVFKKIN